MSPNNPICVFPLVLFDADAEHFVEQNVRCVFDKVKNNAKIDFGIKCSAFGNCRRPFLHQHQERKKKICSFFLFVISLVSTRKERSKEKQGENLQRVIGVAMCPFQTRVY